MWLAFLGAVAGPVVDGLHTWSGAIWYPNPQFLRSVWWVSPLFCGAALSIGLGRLLGERLLPTRPATTRDTTVAMATFLVAYALSGFVQPGEGVMAVVLAVMFATAWWVTDRSLLALGAAALTGFGGWLVEHTLVKAGLFFHRDTGLDGVALWIPSLYCSAALALGALAKSLAQPPKRQPTSS